MSITLEEPRAMGQDRMDGAVGEITMVAETLAMAGQARFGYEYLSRGLDEIRAGRQDLATRDEVMRQHRLALARYAERWRLAG